MEKGTNKLGLTRARLWTHHGRTARNGDNARLEAAIGALETEKCGMATGGYTGDGRDRRFIDLGFTPKAVILCDAISTLRDGSYTYGGISAAGFESAGIAIVEGGFTVRNDGQYMLCNYASGNVSRSYRYLAFR